MLFSASDVAEMRALERANMPFTCEFVVRDATRGAGGRTQYSAWRVDTSRVAVPCRIVRSTAARERNLRDATVHEHETDVVMPVGTDVVPSDRLRVTGVDPDGREFAQEYEITGIGPSAIYETRRIVHVRDVGLVVAVTSPTIETELVISPNTTTPLTLRVTDSSGREVADFPVAFDISAPSVVRVNTTIVDGVRAYTLVALAVGVARVSMRVGQSRTSFSVVVFGVTVREKRVFDSPQVNFIHGSVFVDPYYIGTSRSLTGIVRVRKDSFATYDVALPTAGILLDVTYVPSRGKAYTVGRYNNAYWLIEITPEPFAAATVMALTGFASADGVVNDGDFLYFIARNSAAGSIQKIDLDTLTIVDSVDISAVVPHPHWLLRSAYDGLLYVTSSYSAGAAAKLARYDPNNLSAGALASVQIPGTTDDNCENADYIFGGIELTNPASYGWGWGAYAVRRSDFALFSLPALDADDIPGTMSYYVGVFDDRWLVNLKDNYKLYVIDLHAHPPDTWSQSSDMSAVLYGAGDFEPQIAGWTDEIGNLLVPSAAHRDGDGNMLSFGWPPSGGGNRSGVIRYYVPVL